MHQKIYACEMLKKFEMEHCNPALTSSEPRLQMTKDAEEKEVDATQYRRFMEKPKMSHLVAAKRILRYIKGTMDRGYIFLVGEAPISWCSRKGPVLALSTCEAEYIVASLSACQAVWLSNLINELSNLKCDSVIIKVDNLSAINLAKNSVAHGCSKDIEM
ncbi:hypothetical protein L195_g047135, partial [Trifolium pratense]